MAGFTIQSEFMIQNMPESDSLMIDILHDIRNPLTAIKLAHQQLNDEIARGGDRNDTIIEVLSGIINRNLDKIDQQLRQIKSTIDGQPNRTSRYDISRIVEAALIKASDRIFLSGIRVQQNFIAGHYVTGDLESLTNAFLNIIINAVEAVESGKGQLWITVYKIEDSVKVIFKDDGQGIFPGVKDRIFEPRFSSKPDGLGMGLTIVKQVLDQHNGQISIMSEPGIGTTVMVTFQQ